MQTKNSTAVKNDSSVSTSISKPRSSVEHLFRKIEPDDDGLTAPVMEDMDKLDLGADDIIEMLEDGNRAVTGKAGSDTSLELDVQNALANQKVVLTLYIYLE